MCAHLLEKKMATGSSISIIVVLRVKIGEITAEDLSSLVENHAAILNNTLQRKMYKQENDFPRDSRFNKA